MTPRGMQFPWRLNRSTISTNSKPSQEMSGLGQMGRTIVAWALIVCLEVVAAPTEAAPRCNKSYAEVFQQVAPSVVGIFSVAIDPFSLTERVMRGVGSGVVIDAAGNVVTNAHVVYDATRVMISTSDDDVGEAEVVGFDPISDLAVVRYVPGRAARLQPAPMGDSDALQIGEPVLAVGYPLGLSKTATQGIVSGTKRLLPLTPMSWLTPHIQIDAAISPGNSGGPLLNLCGEVLGINTLAATVGQNVNFAVPINLVREFLPQLLEHGRVIRAWHGIHGRMVPPVLSFTLDIAQGFMVETIEPDSPADRIGLRGGELPVVIGAEEYLLGGDVITRVNGERLTDMDTVVRIVRSLAVGDTVTIDYVRDGAPLTAEVTLPERPNLPGDVRRFRK